MTVLYSFCSYIVLEGVESFDKVVAVCGILDSLEDIWGIFKSLVFGCKVGGCSRLDRPQEVSNKALLEYSSKYGFKWK